MGMVALALNARLPMVQLPVTESYEPTLGVAVTRATPVGSWSLTSNEVAPYVGP